MNICKRKSLICFIAAIIITLSIPLTVLADGITWCPGCGRYSLDYYYAPEPTCTDNGVIEYSCGYCSYFDLEAVPKLGHDFQPAGGADCHTDCSCTRCGLIYEREKECEYVITESGRLKCIHCGHYYGDC